jgi:5'-3' exonuclease
VISVHGCVVQMSFGGHHALNASDQVQKKLQEAMATEELQDALAGIEITDDHDRSDVSMEQRIAEDMVSIASSAASMERQALEQRVVELETQLLRANAQRTAARAATAAELRNQAIHDRVLAATTGIATVITTMDTYTLWWVSQWVDWRKSRIAENGDPVNAAHFRSYKDWVRVIGAKAAAGMGGGTSPQTPQ